MKLTFILCYCFIIVPFIAGAQAPIEFIQNKGQWDGAFEYRGTTNRGDVFLQNDGFTYLIADESNHDKIDAYHHGQIKQPPTLRFHAYKVTFEGANTAQLAGSKPQPNYYNYFLGNDSTRWKTGIHPYFNVDYKQLYNGIDVNVTSEKGNMVYDLIAQPNADVNHIRMRYTGAERLSLKKGNLVISTSLGDMTELKPYAYQYINGIRTVVACDYKVEDNVVTFSFPDGYNHEQTLVIDPTIVFCTFTGSSVDNWGFTATYDDAGNFYAGGLANGTGYPTSTGAFQMTYGGGTYLTNSFYACDMAIIKYNPSGNQRIWATYIGGDNNEQPHSMIVDKNNNLVIAGRTFSKNYPVTPGAFDISQNSAPGDSSSDIVVTVLNATATALIGSTYVGGTGDDGLNFDANEFHAGNLKHNYGDDSRSEVQIDNAGNIYVASCTKSTDFPFTTGTAIQTTLKGGQDGVIFKMNPTLTTMLWSTYIGGSNDDAAYVLAFNNAQTSLYVGGGTMSNDFPSTAGTLHNAYQGATDGFLLKFQNSGTYPLQQGTFIGTPNYDQCYGIQVDLNDNVYVMGQTLGGTFPVTAGVYSNPGSSQYIMKLDNTLTNNLQSTVIGSGNSTLTNISPVAFLVDTCENVYLSGWSGGLGLIDTLTRQLAYNVGTCVGMPTTPNATQSTTDGYDFYFICLNKDMQNIVYGSFFGRSSTNPGKGEHVDGGTSRFDKNGVIYQAICGGCNGGGGTSTAFPTTPGSWSPTNGFPGNCNEIALKIDFQLGPVKAGATVAPNARGCAPFTVQFTNTTNNGVSYLWDFGDNTATTTQSAPSHTFTTAGTYTVTLAASNSNACIIVEDSATLTIVVDTVKIHPAFTYVASDTCEPFVVSVTNTSQYSSSAGSQNFTVFQWTFGDGSTYTGATPPDHTYNTGGTYTITLTMIDTSACNSPDSVSQTFTLNSKRVGASFTSPDTVCRGSQVTFDNKSINGQTYYWDFGDGNTTTNNTTSHTYDSIGVYTVTLVVDNPGACNRTDTFIRKITVVETPIADFTFQPYPPKTNTPITFTNLSKFAETYLWDFGDGKTSIEENPVHDYIKTDYFKVCLTARNRSSCPSILCKDVPTDIVPLANIPTGFSPNGDGKNDVLYVRGANIGTMDLKIYNRWGELVFETTSQSVGWDGTYNGKPQEMDAFAYVLDVNFLNGTSLHKQGNVTLLR